MGSIPAGAGEPSSSLWSNAPDRVYPRGCGGTDFVPCVVGGGHGLSPRVRGNLLKVDVDQAVCGSIPAGAGEPSSSLWSNAPDRVYPRGCGGTDFVPCVVGGGHGLSPRVRGNLLKVDVDQAVCGSIPAGAGEPSSSLWSNAPDRVYPRGCGGTDFVPCVVGGGHGLSPRVRGNLLKVDVDQAVCGSIPAGAGEPSSSLWSNAPDRVYPRGCGGTDFVPCVVGGGHGYPRGCGGTYLKSMLTRQYAGLSPRVRGNRLRPMRCRRWSWSIPAGAGEPT